MSSSAFETVTSIMSPVDASKLSGRYETTAEVNGKPVQVLRSIRHAPRNLVLRGSLTPNKPKPSSIDVDDLCDLFQTKAKVTPTKKKKAPSARYAKKTADKEADSVKENLGKTLKSTQKSGIRFSDDTKVRVIPAVSPVRRSRRLSRG